jgi:hypothetical protein
MRNRFAAAWFALASIAVVVPVRAETPMTSLRIEVKTLSDKPIERASVTVKFGEGRSVILMGKKINTTWQIKTNQEGIAKIPPLPQGKILIQVYAKGYQTYGDTIEVNEPEKVVEVKLNPPQPQYSAH